MSPLHLWRLCLVASLCLHLMLLNADYPQETVLADQPITVPVAFETLPSPSSGENFALRQVVAMAGAEEGRSPEDYRRLCLAEYLARVKAAVEKQKFQPPGADFSRVIGNVRYAFAIDDRGGFSNVRLLRSSGSLFLDKAARTAIARASGRLKRPAIIGPGPIPMALTVKYQYGL